MKNQSTSEIFSLDILKCLKSARPLASGADIEYIFLFIWKWICTGKETYLILNNVPRNFKNQSTSEIFPFEILKCVTAIRPSASRADIEYIFLSIYKPIYIGKKMDSILNNVPSTCKTKVLQKSVPLRYWSVCYPFVHYLVLLM